MGRWVVEQIVLEMARRGQVIAGAGFLFWDSALKRTAQTSEIHGLWM